MYVMNNINGRVAAFPIEGLLCDGRENDGRDIDRWENDGGRVPGTRRVIARG